MPVRTRKRGRTSTKSPKSAEPPCPVQATAPSVAASDKNQNADEGTTDSSKRVEAEPLQKNGKLEAQSKDCKLLLSDGPVILQCSKCRSILADTSNAVVNCDMQRGTISLSSVRGIKLSTDVTATVSGAFSNCAYREMQCEHCEQVVGRKYLSTTTQFDSIRGAFTLHVSCLVTYKLGSGKTPPSNNSSKPDSSDAHASTAASILDLVQGLCSSVHELTAWMRTMQSENAQLRQNFLALESRLHRLENSCSDK